MNTLLSEEDREAIADRVAEKLASENPGVLVTRQVCDDRYSALQTIVQHICMLSRIELIGVIVTILGIIITVILIAAKG